MGPFLTVINKRETAAKGKGGATLGAGRDMSPPLLRDVPRKGYNPVYVVHLWGTTAGRKGYAIHTRL